MMDFFLWYLLVTLIGVAAFPAAYSMLPGLPDRGYTLARSLGLLLWGYFYWLLASLQLIPNNTGGILLALLLLAALSVWISFHKSSWQSMYSWLRQEWKLLLTGELLFLVAFAGWTMVRAANPDIVGTEKPMELAFINSILRSPEFPPNDPWLSGYGISYYYFGYVIVALLSRLSGISSGVGFNLAIALWFSLTALGAFGVVGNLLAIGRPEPVENRKSIAWPSLLGGLLAPLFILLVSNIEGFLEVLHSGGVFWYQDSAGAWRSPFWAWLDLQELNQPPSPPFDWTPERWGGIWWWRASRVLQDYDMAGASREIIDEFPAFSYLLADLHPHLLAMPFALLAVAVGLNQFIAMTNARINGGGFLAWLKSLLWGGSVKFTDLWLSNYLQSKDFWLSAVILGGLSFLNTWDFPIYIGLFGLSAALARYQNSGWSWERLGDILGISALLGAAGFLLYLPFYLGFSSQAGGVLPSLAFFTRGKFFWVMFASLLLPVLAWLAWSWKQHGSRKAALFGLKLSLYLTAGLWVGSYLLGAIFTLLDGIAKNALNGGTTSSLLIKLSEWGDLFYSVHGTRSAADLLGGSFFLRLSEPGAILSLVLLLILTLGLIHSISPNQVGDNYAQSSPPGTAAGFVLLLILLGAGLVLIPEFFYLRDQFGWRMNTIFKFYFQAWIFWGLAAAFGSAILVQRLSPRWLPAFGLGWIILLAMSLAYPFFGITLKSNAFNPSAWNLDGTFHMTLSNPDEARAIEMLKTSPYGVVAEAVGGSYSGAARVSTHSGLPAVLGWPGHESQWRGGAREMGSREGDLQTLYRTADWQEALTVIDRYKIRYVFVGPLERSTYRVNETKFQKNLRLFYQRGMVAVYEVQ